MMMEMKPRRVTSYTMILKEKLRRRRMEEKMSAKRKAEAPLSECTGEEEARKVARLTNEQEEEEDTKDQRIRLVELGSDPMKGWTVCEEEDDEMTEELDWSQSDDDFEWVPSTGDEGTSSEDTVDANDENDVSIDGETTVDSLCLSQTLRDLRESCRIRGLNTQGKKTQLAARLIEAASNVNVELVS